MSETVIIKLLRRKTGVNALLNKIYSIEKPSTSIQLTELNQETIPTWLSSRQVRT
ncbi:hypothetical protein Gorai_024797, partial [Gossypium raimondii]|nr:hypothetical protein [Gossypium raimondii]